VSHSLRARLTVSLLAVLTTALLLLSLVLHVIIAAALERQFDARLSDDASAVAGMAEEDGASAEFEYESLPDFERDERAAYFEVWLDDGTVLSRSPSLGGRDLPRMRDRGFSDIVLPDGRAGRANRLRQALRVEPPAGAAVTTPHKSTRYAMVVVARGTEELLESLASLRRWLAFLAVLTLAGMSGAVLVVVSRSLRSTRALAAEIGGIDVARLGRVAPSEGLPQELAPVVRKLNELLERVDASFAREKRFTADVSHELRTPLAALRTMFEVTTLRERSASEYRAVLVEAGAVVRQMQALCENLLALARLDSGRIPVRSEEVTLHALVEECWRPLAARAAERDLVFANELDPAEIATTDGDQLRIVVLNLLSNAVSYTAPGGAIRVGARAAGESDGVLLEVRDTGPRIPEDVMPHIFERFYRGDPARADGLHCGIGLALARGLADTLGLAVTAENTAEDGVSFLVRRSSTGPISLFAE
jgi:signal transduction histidine kinase